MAGKVVALRKSTVSLDDVVGRFLAERDLSSGTRRVYGVTFRHLVDDLGADKSLSGVTSDHLQHHLKARYGKSAPATHNRNLASIQSLFGWAVRKRLLTENPADELERRKERRTARQADQARAITRQDLEILWGRSDIALRDKTLWRLLYETGCRASEALGIDIENIDLAEKSARVTAKGGDIQRVHWATATARLLPRLIGDRTSGPLFLTDRRSRQVVAQGDLDPASGRARLSYRRTAEIFTEATGGLTLHQLRHSQLTHLAEEGVDVALLKAKSRHQSLRSLERYVRPSDASVAKLTADHDPARRNRRG
jgi:site-specific recombinase XerD